MFHENNYRYNLIEIIWRKSDAHLPTSLSQKLQIVLFWFVVISYSHSDIFENNIFMVVNFCESTIWFTKRYLHNYYYIADC